MTPDNPHSSVGRGTEQERLENLLINNSSSYFFFPAP